MLWFRVPEKTYFKYGCLPVALAELGEMGKKKAFIVTDKVLFEMGYTNKVTEVLEAQGIQYKIFSDVEPNPTLFHLVVDQLWMLLKLCGLCMNIQKLTSTI